MNNDWNSIDITILLLTADTMYQVAVTGFYKVIHPFIMNFVKRNEELANDIFLKVLTKLNKYDPQKGKLHNFIYTIIKNDYLEFCSKKPIVFVEISRHIMEQNQDPNKAMYDRIDELMATLSRSDRSFIEVYVQPKTQNTPNKKPVETAKFFYLMDKLRKLNKQIDQTNL